MNTRRSLPRFIALASIPAVLAAAAWLLRSEPTTAHTLPTRKLVDLHCHAAGIGAGGSGCFVADRLRHSYKFDWYLRAFGTSEAELERRGDAVVIDRISERLARTSGPVGRGTAPVRGT